MRGWSWLFQVNSWHRLVFPVYAGVIPGASKIWSICTSVPRVCGGDPIDIAVRNNKRLCSPCMRGWSSAQYQSPTYPSVFPVYAGVILTYRRVFYFNPSVPRVCGGDPLRPCLFYYRLPCSPCMRGWSFSVFTSLFRSFVFPVRTGVLWIYHDNNMEYKRSVRFEYFFSNNFTSLLTFYKFNDLYKKARIK